MNLRQLYYFRTIAELEHYTRAAEKLFVSRTTLLTTFKQYTGVTFNNYILNCRIKKAISMLKEGKAEQEVAEVCGFSDSSAFIKSFKKVYRITPMQYLKQ